MTCIHDNMTNEQRHEALQEGREWLSEQPPMPTAKELAAPIIAGLQGLYDTFEGRAKAMEFDYEQGEYVDEANELCTTVDDVVAFVRAEIMTMVLLEASPHVIAPMIDPIIRAITDTDRIAVTRTFNRLYQRAG